MIYGVSYEGRTRECDNCGNVSSVHHDCDHCQGPICEDCAVIYGDGWRLCGECVKEVCEHLNIRVEEGEDVNDEYVTRFQQITCLDCGQELIEKRNGDLVARKPKPCKHKDVHCEVYEESNGAYTSSVEIHTCRDCGVRIDEDGEIVTGRAA